MYLFCGYLICCVFHCIVVRHNSQAVLMSSMVHRLLAMASSFWSQWCNIGYGGAGLFVSFTVIVVGPISWHILRKESLALPPGPRGMPVLGNLPFLHPDFHSCFAKMVKKYGPVMRLWFGNKLTCTELTLSSKGGSSRQRCYFCGPGHANCNANDDIWWLWVDMGAV